MKTKIATIIGVAILGVTIAFVITNFFTGSIEDFSYKIVVGTINADVASPDPEIFNYRALNPTVEVYVGECEEYDEFGGCLKGEDDIEDSFDEKQNVNNNGNTITQENVNNSENSNNVNSAYDLDDQGSE